MDMTNHLSLWFNMIDRPAFCVKNGIIVAANAAAEHRTLCVGASVDEIVCENKDTYETFQSGSLYLTIYAGGFPCNASVTRTEEYDIFMIRQDTDDERLQALALAAQQLRVPLSNVMTEVDRLLVDLNGTDPETLLQARHINRGLFQLLRIVVNMSDASRYHNGQQTSKENLNLTSLFDEILGKMQSVASASGIQIQYTGLEELVFGMADSELLERAIHNLLSNAIKFASPGSTVSVSLTKNGDRLSLTVCNIGTGEERDFWNQYRREPAIEDSRCGLGLGITLVCAAASAHGGTLLVDHPSADMTRVTMSIKVTEKTGTDVKSPIIHLGDYAGGRDKSLLEFSEILSPESYANIN